MLLARHRLQEPGPGGCQHWLVPLGWGHGPVTPQGVTDQSLCPYVLPVPCRSLSRMLWGIHSCCAGAGMLGPCARG